MESVVKTIEKKEIEEEFSFKNYFSPMTTVKAVVWIVIIGLIGFFNSLFGAFVWDDVYQIQNNTLVHSILNIGLYFTGSTFSQSQGAFEGLYYRPLMTTVFSLLYTIFGTQTFFFHFFQLSIHILNAIL